MTGDVPNKTAENERGPVAHFNGLSPAAAESLALIAEECAEVSQVITKILRHGLFSHHPESGDSNFMTLQREVGDLMAALRIGEVQRIINWGQVIRSRDSKLVRVTQYLHHAKVVSDDPE